MAKQFKAPKTVTWISLWLGRRGVGRLTTLTTLGRRSGELREVPVSPITLDGVEYLVAPYGSVGWVVNVRANPEVIIRSGKDIRHLRLDEVTAQAAQVVEAYYRRESFPRKYMDVPGEATVDDFAGVSHRFPVFRIVESA